MFIIAIASQLGVLMLMGGGIAIISGFCRAAVRILLIGVVLIVASAFAGSHSAGVEQTYVLG